MKPSNQPEPSPIAPQADLSPFEALLEREHKPESKPVKSEFEALLERPSPLAKPEPKQSVYVWLEKEISMGISVCAVCGFASCGCTPRILKTLTKTIRYQVKQ